jgi:hypothetical protein
MLTDRKRRPITWQHAPLLVIFLRCYRGIPVLYRRDPRDVERRRLPVPEFVCLWFPRRRRGIPLGIRRLPCNRGKSRQRTFWA